MDDNVSIQQVDPTCLDSLSCRHKVVLRLSNGETRETELELEEIVMLYRGNYNDLLKISDHFKLKNGEEILKESLIGDEVLDDMFKF